MSAAIEDDRNDSTAGVSRRTFVCELPAGATGGPFQLPGVGGSGTIVERVCHQVTRCCEPGVMR